MEEKELLEIIEEAARDGRTELDLSDEGIKSLPAEIGRLTNLTALRLCRNQLTSVPHACTPARRTGLNTTTDRASGRGVEYEYEEDR